jgi:hypothetical protein
MRKKKCEANSTKAYITNDETSAGVTLVYINTHTHTD